VALSEEITSPELILVAPPEIAARARERLPASRLDFDEWATRVAAAGGAEVAVQPQEENAEVEAVQREPKMGAAEFWTWYESARPQSLETPLPEQRRRLGTAAFAFTFLAFVLCLIPLVLLIAYRW
jgi:hypothetical protein